MIQHIFSKKLVLHAFSALLVLATTNLYAQSDDPTVVTNVASFQVPTTKLTSDQITTITQNIMHAAGSDDEKAAAIAKLVQAYPDSAATIVTLAVQISPIAAGAIVTATINTIITNSPAGTSQADIEAKIDTVTDAAIKGAPDQEANIVTAAIQTSSNNTATADQIKADIKSVESAGGSGDVTTAVANAVASAVSTSIPNASPHQ